MIPAHYHQHHSSPLPCLIAVDHGDGTLSLTRAAGQPPFVRCALRAAPATGYATLLREERGHSCPLPSEASEPPPVSRKRKRPTEH